MLELAAERSCLSGPSRCIRKLGELKADHETGQFVARVFSRWCAPLLGTLRNTKGEPRRNAGRYEVHGSGCVLTYTTDKLPRRSPR